MEKRSNNITKYFLANPFLEVWKLGWYKYYETSGLKRAVTHCAWDPTYHPRELPIPTWFNTCAHKCLEFYNETWLKVYIPFKMRSDALGASPKYGYSLYEQDYLTFYTKLTYFAGYCADFLDKLSQWP